MTANTDQPTLAVLKPCPHCVGSGKVCQGRDRTSDGNGWLSVVVCQDCGSRGPEMSEADAVDAWNSRPNSEPRTAGDLWEARCGASPDHADIMETIENASDAWQKQGYTSALAEVRDMANVGRALMEALPEGYSYMNCPSEIVSDLQNERDEALATHSPAPAGEEARQIIADMVRLADMGFEESLREPEENGNYAAYERAKRYLAAHPSTQGV